MKKKSFFYTDLTKKQLEHLKKLYVTKKVNCMSNDELKKFVSEIISHQINDTIGKEEEKEAWDEMAIFFGEDFENCIAEIQIKFKDVDINETIMEDPQQKRIDLLEKNIIGNEKKDMWDD